MNDFYELRDRILFHELLARIRPLTFADRLAKMAGLPANTLGKHYRWVDGKPDGRPCPVKHQAAVVRALVDVYGAVVVGGEVVGGEVVTGETDI